MKAKERWGRNGEGMKRLKGQNGSARRGGSEEEKTKRQQRPRHEGEEGEEGEGRGIYKCFMGFSQPACTRGSVYLNANNDTGNYTLLNGFNGSAITSSALPPREYPICAKS
jgi:hypothetical protein